MKFNEIKSLTEEELFEINMSLGNLRSLAKNIDARAGMEFEMIVPVAGLDDSDGESEPDYSDDPRSRSWEDIREFFNDGDWNSRRDVDRLMEKLQEEFYEYADEKIFEDFLDDQYNIVKEWVVNNVSDEDIMDAGFYEEDDRAKFEDDAEFRKKVIKDYVDNAIENQTSDWESAKDEYRDDVFGDFEEGSWLQRNYPYMSDISGTFDINWPIWSYPENDGGSIEAVAGDFEDAIGRKVNYSSSYHGAKRTPDAYTVEPDSSLDPDNRGESGLEFISPPLPIDQMLDDLEKVVKWAKRMGCYTNDSTGLHMNISVPDMSTAKLDYVKLALLLGDEYVLDQFGRSANTYTKSAMKIVRDRVSQRPEDAAAMLKQMKDHLEVLATKAIHTGETSKYTSINTKGNYIEFRSPGGDWLGEYAKKVDKLENTLLRFVVATDAAMDPDKYRNEYLKKLYKLLAPNGDGKDTLSYFAKFAAGEMPKAALKSFIKQAQLERNLKKGNVGGEKFWWEVSRPGYMASIEVVASSKEEALAKAVEPGNYPDWAWARNLEARPVRPYDMSPVQATVGEPIPVGNQRPAGAAGSVKYEMFNRETDQIYRTYWAADDQMAIEIGNRYRDEMTQSQGMTRASIGLRRAPLEGSTVDLQRQRAARAQQQQQQGGEGSRNHWSQTDIENRLGRGGQEADANYEVVDRSNNRSIFNFIANTPQEAQRKYTQVLDVLGLPHDTENYGFREIALQGSTVDLQRQRAAQSQQQQQGSREFTGTWLVRDENGRVIHRISGIGNAQSDANRHAMNWLRANPENMRDGIEVVPEMR